jgi:tetratricopeptide (TPR) repeat protein
MWDLAVREEDYERADSMMRRMKSPPLSMRILLTFARGDSAARRRIMEEARAADSRQSQIAGRYVATFLNDLPTAKSLTELDLSPGRKPPIRADAQLLLAWLELARGRWTAAKGAFAAAERLTEATPVLVQRTFAATLPFLAVPRSDLDSLRREVELWNVGTEVSGPGAGLASQLNPHLRLYLLGLLSSRLGDYEGARRMARDIERRAGPDEARAVIRALALTIRADVALQDRSAQAAGQELEEVQGKVPLELVRVPAYANLREFTQEHSRYLRIFVLRAQQKQREALSWMETSFQGSPSEIVYAAPMHLAQAEVHEGLGEREQAVEHYRRFLVLWRDCDPELRPVLERARSELARLTAEPR